MECTWRTLSDCIMHYIYFKDGVFSLSLCLVNTLPLWWADGCWFCFLCKYPMAFRLLPMSCLVLFSISCSYIYLGELILDTSKTKPHKAFHQRLFLLLSSLKSTSLIDSHCCVWAEDAGGSSSHLPSILSFEISPKMLSIYINRLVFVPHKVLIL